MEVVRELVLPAPPEEVWEALTDPQRLQEWFANEVERDGDSIVYRWENGEERRATIEEVDEGRRLTFRWADPSAPEDETTVAFQLDEEVDGTRLVVTETLAQAELAVGGWTTAFELRTSFQGPLALAGV